VADWVDIGDNSNRPQRRRYVLATAEQIDLMTAEEFGARPDPGHPEELVRGRIVDTPPPDRRHGYVCLKAGRILGDFVDRGDIGRAFSNDSGIITERGPDTVRGADVCVYSFAQLPKGPLAAGYGPEIPELVVEVLSKNDRWRDVYEKVGEYLRVGVDLVIVLDPDPLTAHLFSADVPPRTLVSEDELILPPPFDGFRERVGRFFD
jgi:Uma2 family endonuclease